MKHYSPVHDRDKTAVQTLGAPGRSDPKLAKTILPARKGIVSVSWDSRGVVLIDYL